LGGFDRAYFFLGLSWAGGLLKQALLSLWSRACSKKRQGYQCPVVPRKTDFTADPPAFFMRPVSAHGPRWPITHIALDKSSSADGSVQEQIANKGEHVQQAPTQYQLHEAEGAVSVAAATLDLAPTLATGTQRTSKGLGLTPLQPSERYVLARQAMISDTEYRRLLEHNRWEIRETQEGRKANVAQKVHGWGVWVT